MRFLDEAALEHFTPNALLRTCGAQQYTAQDSRGRARVIYSRKQQVANDVN